MNAENTKDVAEKTVQANSAVGGVLDELIGKTIKKIEADGGSKYGRTILIMFDEGLTLNVCAELDVSSYSISPRLNRNIGGWAELS
jgi:hypothetical protein